MENKYDNLVPANRDAEWSLLGAWLQDDDKHTFFLASGGIQAEDFYWEDDMYAAQAIIQMVKENRRTEPVAVSDTIVKAHHEKSFQDTMDSTVTSYLRGIVIANSSTTNVPYWANMVKELSRKRLLARISRDTYDLAMNPAYGADDCEKVLSEGLMQGKAERKDRTFAEIAQSAVMRISTGKEEVQRGWAKTYIASIDMNLGAFQPQSVGIVAGLPSTGKSSIAGFICLKNAEHGLNVGFISLEMTAEDVFNRMVACEAGLCNQSIRDMTLLPDEMTRYYTTAGRIAELPIHIIDACEQSEDAVMSAIRRCAVTYDCKFVVIDYIQLVYGKKATSSRNEELARFTATMKVTAKALDIYILEVSQLSRDSVKEGRKPRLQDLRDSGAIEQNADDVLLLSELADGNTPDQVSILADLAKHRGGRKDTSVVTFSRRFQQWSNSYSE